MKKRTSINISESLIEKVKNEKLNLSLFVENRLRRLFYNDKIIDIKKKLHNKISYCGSCKERKPLNEICVKFDKHEGLISNYCYDCYHKPRWETLSQKDKDGLKSNETVVGILKTNSLYDLHQEGDGKILSGDEMFRILLKLKIKEVEDNI